MSHTLCLIKKFYIIVTYNTEIGMDILDRKLVMKNKRIITIMNNAKMGVKLLRFIPIPIFD